MYERGHMIPLFTQVTHPREYLSSGVVPTVWLMSPATYLAAREKPCRHNGLCCRTRAIMCSIQKRNNSTMTTMNRVSNTWHILHQQRIHGLQYGQCRLYDSHSKPRCLRVESSQHGVKAMDNKYHPHKAVEINYSTMSAPSAPNWCDSSSHKLSRTTKWKSDLLYFWWYSSIYRLISNIRRTFSYTFLEKNWCILIHSSQTYVPLYPINIISAFVRVGVWPLRGNEPLLKPMFTPQRPSYDCVSMWKQCLHRVLMSRTISHFYCLTHIYSRVGWRTWFSRNIRVTSNERSYDASNYRQLYSLFNSVFKPTANSKNI